MRYILEGKNPKPCPDLIEWAWFIENSQQCRVALDFICEMKVSTIFLGTDCNFSEQGSPILFETMVFGEQLPDLDQLQRQYSTWDEAVTRHKDICALIIAEKMFSKT